MRTRKPTARLCHREGCSNVKRHGRSYRYCSDECARLVALADKRVSSAAWREGQGRQTLRTQQLWSRYRLTPEEFDSMLAAQDGRCAICGTPDPGGPNWHVDHDHRCCPGRRSCGRCRRGLLCAHCNRHVLAIVENPELLAAALAYLRRWERQ